MTWLLNEEIGETVGMLAANPDLAAEQLIVLANDNGGRDNVSVILAKVVQDFAHPRSWWQGLFHRLATWFT